MLASISFIKYFSFSVKYKAKGRSGKRDLREAVKSGDRCHGKWRDAEDKRKGSPAVPSSRAWAEVQG